MTKHSSILAIAAISLFTIGCAGSPKLTQPLQAPVSFKSEVKPLLDNRCFTCHNEQGGAGDLDLTSRETALRSSPNGPFIVPGSPDQSKLFRVLTIASDAPGAMPPTDHTLTQSQIDLIRQWIEQGADWPA